MDEYIKREEIIKRFKARLSASHPGSISEAYYKACLDVVESQPAADVRPVIHSFWGYNPGDNFPYCDNCGMPQDARSDFCHACGADMREKADG